MLSNQKYTKKNFLCCSQLFSRFAEFEINIHLPSTTSEKVDFTLDLIIGNILLTKN